MPKSVDISTFELNFPEFADHLKLALLIFGYAIVRRIFDQGLTEVPHNPAYFKIY